MMLYYHLVLLGVFFALSTHDIILVLNLLLLFLLLLLDLLFLFFRLLLTFLLLKTNELSQYFENRYTLINDIRVYLRGDVDSLIE
jgi:hypothetical protein